MCARYVAVLAIALQVVGSRAQNGADHQYGHCEEDHSTGFIDAHLQEPCPRKNDPGACETLSDSRCERREGCCKLMRRIEWGKRRPGTLIQKVEGQDSPNQLGSAAPIRLSASDTMAQWCDSMEKLGSKNMRTTEAEMGKIFQGFAALFTDKVDCSEDPNNPILGYDLKGVSFMECSQEKIEKTKNHPEIAIQFSETKCMETIVAEDGKTAAAWVHMTNTGDLHSKFGLRLAIRISLNDDAKITSYHGIYDSYNFIKGGSDLAGASAGANSVSQWALVVALSALSGGVIAALFIQRTKKENVLLAA